MARTDPRSARRKQRPVNNPGRAKDDASSRTKTVLLWVGVGVLVLVVVFGTLTIKREIHDHACNSYRQALLTALGDGVSQPAPSTAGLTAQDAARVAAWRAGYRHQIDTTTAGQPPTAAAGERRFLARLWTEEAQGDAGIVMSSRGC